MAPIMDSPFLALGAFVVFLLVAVGIILILWIVMPFSVFSIRNLLKKAVEEQEKTNRLLGSIIEELERRSLDKEKPESSEK